MLFDLLPVLYVEETWYVYDESRGGMVAWLQIQQFGSRAGKLTGWECGQARHALVRHCTATCGAHPAQLCDDATIALYNPNFGRIQHPAAATYITEIQTYALL